MRNLLIAMLLASMLIPPLVWSQVVVRGGLMVVKGPVRLIIK